MGLQVTIYEFSDKWRKFYNLNLPGLHKNKQIKLPLLVLPRKQLIKDEIERKTEILLYPVSKWKERGPLNPGRCFTTVTEATLWLLMHRNKRNTDNRDLKAAIGVDQRDQREKYSKKRTKGNRVQFTVLFII